MRFTYYGTTYIVDRGAVLDIESAADGQTVTLTVDRYLLPGDPDGGRRGPRPSDSLRPRPAADRLRAAPVHAAGRRWRRSHDVPTLQEVLAQYATESFSYGDTNSNGMADDSGPNDSITDYVQRFAP